jgi:hypothetical protein
MHIVSIDGHGLEHRAWKCIWIPEVGKVTLKSTGNGDEWLSDESLLKSNGDKALTMIFHKK